MSSSDLQLRGPRQMLAALKHPATPEAYRSAFARRAKRLGIRVRVAEAALHPYVNGGRWVADCVSCGGGIAVHPAWAYAACLDCGTEYTHLDVPAHWREIEAALAGRHHRHQNWLRHQSVGDLHVENRLAAAGLLPATVQLPRGTV